jgi:hypothetical protein
VRVADLLERIPLGSRLLLSGPIALADRHDSLAARVNLIAVNNDN